VDMVSNSFEVRNHAWDYKDFYIFHGALERFGIYASTSRPKSSILISAACAETANKAADKRTRSAIPAFMRRDGTGCTVVPRTSPIRVAVKRPGGDTLPFERGHEEGRDVFER
jgi:hypothetical protein